VIEMTYTVDWGEGEKSATSNGWTIIQWERKTKQKFSTVQQNGIGLEDMYILAWIALRDAGHVVPDFDRFAKSIVSFGGEAAGDQNPTDGAAGADA